MAMADILTPRPRRVARPRPTGVESFGERVEQRGRVGLQPQHAELVAYVYCEWGDMGTSVLARYQQEREAAARIATSATPGKFARLVRAPRGPRVVGEPSRRETRWARQDAALERYWRTMDVPAESVSGYAADHVYAPERWLGQYPWRIEEGSRGWREAGREVSRREAVARCWAALSAISAREAVTLYALYGPMPPCLPPPGTWGAHCDAEYRRVVRLVEGSGGSSAELSRRLRSVDKVVRLNESAAAYKARVAEAEYKRAEYVRGLGKACAGLILGAVRAFEREWDEGNE